MAQLYGRTWWGQQWLKSLDRIDYENRLDRGRSYARKGAVTAIKIQANIIEAKVQGSRPKPYEVQIVIPPFFEPEKFILLQNQSIQRGTFLKQYLNRPINTFS